MKKHSTPHLDTTKGSIDLYFELLDKNERQELIHDILSGETVELPNFGPAKNVVRNLNKKDISQRAEDFIKRFLNVSGGSGKLKYDEETHKYVRAFINKIYHFNDIPNKKKRILERTKEIYPDIELEVIEEILNDVKIVFRKQDEKGASNHILKTIYVSTKEIKRENLKNEDDFKKYLEKPESVITHEVTHIFQNIFKAFPETKYLKKEKGNWEIDYKKYKTDLGEIQARIEQVLEWLEFGFTKNEIAQELYNRKHKDKKMWLELISEVEEMKEETKTARSKLPFIDNAEKCNEDDNVTNEQDRYKNEYNQKGIGKNYEKDYLT